MLEFAILADRRRLAVTFRHRGLNTQGCNRTLRQQFAKLLANGHQLRQVFDVLTRAGVLDHGDGSCAARGWIYFSAHLALRFLHEDGNLADAGFHRSPSSPLISDALRPPTRAWIRAPVVMTSASKISSARGASASPTSIASKWLRT